MKLANIFMVKKISNYLLLRHNYKKACDISRLTFSKLTGTFTL